jgi:polyisoprenoid-binding protein YceI
MRVWTAAIMFLALAFSIVIAFSFAGLHPNDSRPTKPPSVSTTMGFQLDPSQSTFMVRAFRGGPAWFKGHDHYIAARDFSGVAELSPDALTPASLQLTVRADSLEETGAAFTPQQKDIIKNELKEIVLETAKFPEITFRSTEVTGELKNGQFDVKIGGDITLHGVTKHIQIPAAVTLEGDSLRAKGKFKLSRSDFNVKATSAFHGFVRVKDGLEFTFDIAGRRL